jgi:hypothetical protein
MVTILVNRIIVEQAANEILDSMQELDDRQADRFVAWFMRHTREENPNFDFHQQAAAGTCLLNWLMEYSTSTLIFFMEYRLILNKVQTQDDIYAINSK